VASSWNRTLEQLGLKAEAGNEEIELCAELGQQTGSLAHETTVCLTECAVSWQGKEG